MQKTPWKPKVNVIRLRGSRYLALRWITVDGKYRQQSSKTNRRREAERMASTLEKELAAPKPKPSIDWNDCVERYEADRLASRSKAYRNQWNCVNVWIDQAIKPYTIEDLEPQAIVRMVTKMRDAELSEATIETYLKHVRAILRWALDNELIEKVPKITFDEAVKGRPLTTEEFERMLKAAPKVVGKERAKQWRFVLRCLWHSGLRIQEAFRFSWDDENQLSVVDIDVRLPMIRIPAGVDKSGRGQLIPMPPDLVKLLKRIPPNRRRGRILPVINQKGTLYRDHNVVGKIIAEIGKKAKIVVKRDGETIKYASAHDLRRSFAERWAMVLPFAMVKKLLRHSDERTTLKYYARHSAELIAREMWRAGEDEREERLTNGKLSPKETTA